MSNPFDETLIEKAASRLSHLPGFGGGVSRRENLRNMIYGMFAATMAAPAVAAPNVPAAPDAQTDLRAAPNEEVIVCYFSGEGKFSADLRYINLNMTMYDLDGKAIGMQHGVHESLSDLPYMFTTPPTPAPMFDEPPVPAQLAQEWTKGIWTFGDDSNGVYAAGPARTHIVPFVDGSLLFTVTTGQTITGGIGEYKNAYGVKQATGSAYIPASIVQSGQFPAPNFRFTAHTVEVFRILVPKSS